MIRLITMVCVVVKCDQSVRLRFWSQVLWALVGSDAAGGEGGPFDGATSLLLSFSAADCCLQKSQDGHCISTAIRSPRKLKDNRLTNVELELMYC